MKLYPKASQNSMNNQTFNIVEDLSVKQKCFSPKGTLFRYLGLVLMCLMGFGSYFCLDNPGALQDKFETDLNLSASNSVLLYSVYSWPNVILCFIGGFLLDRVFGIRWGSIIYVSLTLCGQLLFAVGTYVNVFWLMILGRFIFGIGAESAMVAQYGYSVLWFKGRGLNALFGLQISVVKFASAANSLSLESIYEVVSENTNYTGSQCIGIVLFIAATICVGSLICALLVGYMDSCAEKVSSRNKVEKPELVQITDVKDFEMTFWMIVLVIVAYYIAILPFISLAKLYFMTKYDFEPDQANAAISVVYGITAVFSPLFGISIDKTGKNIVWILISIVGSLLAHGLLAFTYSSPYIGMVFLGISYSMLASSVWPMIALVIPEHQLGTAYGLAQALQNLNLAVMSIISGIIVENYGYFTLELFFLAWLLLSLIPAIAIIWISRRKSNCNN